MSHDELNSIAPENPPAFPSFERTQEWSDRNQQYNELQLPVNGMLLRDYFAAKALQALITNNALMRNDAAHNAEFAGAAYEFADAMLKERAK